jgi:hypothetical protein
MVSTEAHSCRRLGRQAPVPRHNPVGQSICLGHIAYLNAMPPVHIYNARRTVRVSQKLGRQTGASDSLSLVVAQSKNRHGHVQRVALEFLQSHPSLA